MLRMYLPPRLSNRLALSGVEKFQVPLSLFCRNASNDSANATSEQVRSLMRRVSQPGILTSDFI
jgi:hypothetical protein